MAKVKVLTVCGFGIGSSLILKMTLDSVLEKAGIRDVDGEPHDVTSCVGTNADLILVSKELEPQINGKVNCPLIVISNFLSEQEVSEKVLPEIHALLEKIG